MYGKLISEHVMYQKTLMLKINYLQFSISGKCAISDKKCMKKG